MSQTDWRAAAVDSLWFDEQQEEEKRIMILPQMCVCVCIRHDHNQYSLIRQMKSYHELHFALELASQSHET